MRRPLRPDELRLWRTVASTVRPFAGRILPPEPPPAALPVPYPQRPAAAVPHRPTTPQRRIPGTLHDIEPNRARRIVIGREPIGARLDLHGLDQDRARAALEGFIVQAQLQGHRAVLVITGQGRMGDGVLRRRAPEWLAEPRLRGIVAGVSAADRRHGGDGALFVALKRLA
ncbi:MAG TPA: Smr/MutS family protein [Caulobacteraceae bacterium]